MKAVNKIKDWHEAESRAYVLRTTTVPVLYRGVARAGILGARPDWLLCMSKRKGAHQAAASCEYHFELSPGVRGPMSLFSLDYECDPRSRRDQSHAVTGIP